MQFTMPQMIILIGCSDSNKGIDRRQGVAFLYNDHTSGDLELSGF
jgi:hypothetical protein